MLSVAFYRLMWGFHRTFATGVACWQGLLLRTSGPVPFGTCLCSICWDHSFSQTCNFFRTIHFEHPSVLSRFCLILKRPWAMSSTILLLRARKVRMISKGHTECIHFALLLTLRFYIRRNIFLPRRIIQSYFGIEAKAYPVCVSLAHVFVFFGWHRLIRGVLRASQFSVFGIYQN